MEADAVVEGFLQSVDMYHVKYHKLIADGDSNVYIKILESRPYDNLTVQKIECRNHLLRNYFNKLRDIAKDSKGGFLIENRKRLGGSLRRLHAAIEKSSAHWQKQEVSEEEKIKNLKQNLSNSPYHVFGSHSKCQEYFCDKQNSNSPDYVPDMKADGIFYKIKEHLCSIEDNVESILHGSNNNPVEHFNAKICKKIGGKRINFCLRGSYQARCNSAVVSHNSKSPMTAIHKSLTQRSPGKYTKQRESRIENKLEKARKRRLLNPRPKKKAQGDNSTESYGPLSQRPDLPPETSQAKEVSFLKSLELSKQQREELQTATQGQSRSGMWLEERRKRLTASNFGEVCKMLPATGCGRLVKGMLYGQVDNKFTRYGKVNEESALRKMEQELQITIDKCGLFVDEDIPYLGASPDGLVRDEDGLVEVKCPYTAREKTPMEYLRGCKVKFLVPHTEEDQIVKVNKNHDYYYQIQGQLHIAKRSFCIFAVFSPKGIVIERILKDHQFWETKMEERLKKFYINCLLPELIDPRHPRSLPIREPNYIVLAQEEKERKRKIQNS